MFGYDEMTIEIYNKSLYNRPMIFKTSKQISLAANQNLYKWTASYGNLQRQYFQQDIQYRREKQIHDFVTLNEFQHPWLISDTYILKNLPLTDNFSDADIIIITDQKFSRYPCLEIINRIRDYVLQCPLYLCLNRTYINIDNTYQDQDLSENFNVAITQWLKKSMPELQILDLSLNYLESGQAFTWVIPDRHFYIFK
jgi:hypothetical protein